MNNRASSFNQPMAGPPLGARFLPSLSVGRRVALITVVPVLGLALVFALFTLSQRQVSAQMEASRANLQAALGVKQIRDRIVAAQMTVDAFLLAPSDASARIATGAATAVGTRVAELLAGGTGTLPPEVVDNLKSVAGDIGGIVAAQRVVGYTSDAGLAGRVNAAMRALESTIRDEADMSDPLAAAVLQDYMGMLQGQVRFAMSHAPADREAFAASAAAVHKNLDASFLSTEAKAKIGAAVDAASGAFSAWSEALGRVAAANAAATARFERLSTGIDDIVAGASHAADVAEETLTTIQDRSAATVGMTILAAIALCCTLCLLVGRSISRPVRELARVMRRMTEGDLDVALAAGGGRDEIAEMSRAVEAFRQSALQNLRLEAEAARTRQSVEAEQARREDEKAHEAREARHVVEALGAGLGALSSGDLLTRIEQAFAPTSERLRADFNDAVDRLHATMTEIGGNTVTIQARSQSIAAAAADLSRRTEQQAESLERTAASLDEITKTVRSTADHASHARSVVASAKASAEASGGIVNRAIGAMTDLERSSKQIGQIIGVIDEIAFQTNLLALNAGVEAARAGETGRGFAVVASEVRALAQRSAEAAQQIKGLISASQTQVETGVDLVGQAGKALERIAFEVTDLSDAVSAIASSAAEQAQGLAEVNDAVGAIDKLTQSNAAMVEETTATVDALAGETERLSVLVGRFRTGRAGREPRAGLPPLHFATGRDGPRLSVRRA